MERTRGLNKHALLIKPQYPRREVRAAQTAEGERICLDWDLAPAGDSFVSGRNHLAVACSPGEAGGPAALEEVAIPMRNGVAFRQSSLSGILGIQTEWQSQYSDV